MSTTTGTLKYGLKIGDATHMDFELKGKVTAADYFAAEESVGNSAGLRFSAELVCRQLARIGDFKGPFSYALLGTLHPSDLKALIDARDALEVEGNGYQKPEA
jgi:phage FluMu protein gp41